MWVDRQGRETPIPAPPRAYLLPGCHPMARASRCSATIRSCDLWVWDLGRTTLTRATFDPGVDTYPVWTPDGRRVIFSSERAGVRNLFWQAADGTGAVERLTESPNRSTRRPCRPTAAALIFTETAPKTGDDVMQMELDGTPSRDAARAVPVHRAERQSSRPTAAGSPTRRMTRAGSKSTCGRFPT